jgi:Carboxypeptidase regulatory-like domain
MTGCTSVGAGFEGMAYSERDDQLLESHSGVVWAQVSTGTISGTLKGSSGVALPGAQVVVLNEQTGISGTVESDAPGRYMAPPLSLGNYWVTATREGFQTIVRTGIAVTVGQEAIVDLSLPVGSNYFNPACRPPAILSDRG